VARLPEHLSKAPVGRERLSREALASHQRERILSAATGVFAKRGYQETTIDNIVAAAKASVGSFYQLFDGKEDCFLGVNDRIVSAARTRITGAVSVREGWAAQAFAGMREVLEIYAAEPLAARIVLIELQTAGPAATERYNALIDATTGWLRGGRERYPAADELPPTFEHAAVAGLAFFLQQRLLSSEPQSPQALVADSAQLILEPIIGKAEFAALRGELAGAAGT
jgi:TetR/AcrR family transcriptional regulator